MIGNFDVVLPKLLEHEGGNDDDPRDPGGRTSRGILQEEWDRWRQTHAGRPADVWKAPQADVEAIYKQKYWDWLSCDELPAGVDYAVFDFGVNSGNSRSARYLQNIVGAPEDGIIGPITLKATNDYVQVHGTAALINELSDRRLHFLQGLNTWPTFGKGWGRRVRDVRADSLALVKAAPSTLPPPVRPPAQPEPPMTQVPTPAPAPAPQHAGFDLAQIERGLTALEGFAESPWLSPLIPAQYRPFLAIIPISKEVVEALQQWQNGTHDLPALTNILTELVTDIANELKLIKAQLAKPA